MNEDIKHRILLYYKVMHTKYIYTVSQCIKYICCILKLNVFAEIFDRKANEKEAYALISICITKQSYRTQKLYQFWVFAFGYYIYNIYVNECMYVLHTEN